MPQPSLEQPARSSPASRRRNPSLWIIFLPAFMVVWLAHWPLLRLPYYWDEAGYYIPAAWDFFRTGALIPYSTLSNAHPPLPSIYLAAWWELFSFTPFVTRTSVCVVSAFALTAVWRIALAVSKRRTVALTVTILTGIYPVFFAQSTLAQADIFAAALTLWALAFFFDNRRMAPAVVLFALAALAKETAILTPLALAGWQLRLAIRTRAKRHLRHAALLSIPVLPLLLWYAYYWHKTGFLFGNPQYLRYNATSTLSPLRIAVALWHRTNQITLHMDLFVPVLLALACLLLLDRRTEPDGSPRTTIARADLAAIFVILITNIVFFSVIGGALLTRYLLPLYPLVLLLCVQTLWARLKRWPWVAIFCGAAFLAALFINPPYRFAPEDNLAYAGMIHLQQDAIAQITSRYPGETVLTAWPASDELTKPELGYVTRRIPVVAINNFSYAQVERAAESTVPYTVALVFSTKYAPRWSLIPGRFNQRMDRRYFGFHYDLNPALVAQLLGGRVVWSKTRQGQWAAVIHFDRPTEARLHLP